MTQALDKLTIKGFKSIQILENFELTNLNVLIGGNGAGKSNFIDFFRLLRAMMELPLPELACANLKAYITDGGEVMIFSLMDQKSQNRSKSSQDSAITVIDLILHPRLMKHSSLIMRQDSMIVQGGGKWEVDKSGLNC